MKQQGSNQSVLVLGASGKVGTMLARHWAMSPADGWHFTGQVRGQAAAGQVRWHPGGDPADLPRARAVLALWGALPSQVNPDFDDNVKLGIRALEVARIVGADRVLLASSAAVYGPRAATHLSEAHGQTEPDTAYGQSKLAMERATENWVQTHAGAPALVNLRLTNVIGADSLFAALERSKNITLDRFASNAGPVRSYITAADLATVIQALLNAPRNQLPKRLNVAGTAPIAMQDLVIAAGGNITWQPAPDDATETVILDTQRLEALTGPLLESADAAAAIAGLRKLQVPT